MLDAIFAAASCRVALAAFIFLVLSSMAIGRHNPKNRIREDLKGDYVATDSTFLYDTDKVTRMLARYEPRHYEAHERFILRDDLVYPILYSVTTILILAFFYPWGSAGPRWLVLLPLAAAVFDYAENFTMLAFLRRFRADPQTSLALLKVSRVFTVAKLSVLLLSLVLLAAFFVLGLFDAKRAPASSYTRGDPPT